MECGLTNLALCLPEKFLEYLVQFLNGSVEPLLHIVNYLLTEPVNINLFYAFWAIMVYIISLFYGLFFLFAGINFMVSGYDSAKRENAKSWIRNIILMVLCVQASFVIYNAILEISSILTTSTMGLIDPNFFLLTVDNIVNFALQFSLIIPYTLVLIITVLLLGLRYIFVATGVVLFPFAFFFYFIPPLKSYGKLIFNIILTSIFVTFFDAILLFSASALVKVGIFSSFKIILVTVAFLGVNLFMLILLVFAILKAVFGVMNSEVGRNVKKAVKYLI